MRKGTMYQKSIELDFKLMRVDENYDKQKC